MNGLVSLHDAQKRLLNGVQPLPSQMLAAEQAAGHFLAHDLSAKRSQPAADLSAMDGYAMVSGDIAGPWRVVGESAAGHPFARTLSRGECVRVSTGAVMPQGADAVLLQENAGVTDGVVTLGGCDGPSGTYIRRAGFDFKVGSRLLLAGTRMGPAQIALAIMASHRSVEIGKKPSVAVIDNGDELSNADTLSPHQIPASNGAMIEALCAPLVSQSCRIGPVQDKMTSMIAAFEEAGECDVIIVSGGASVGDHDLVRPALERWGAKIDFWRIAIKPGKPLMVARKGRQIILGLPGNPASAYVTSFLFALPLLRRLGGSSASLPDKLRTRLTSALPSIGPRAEFIRAKIDHTGVSPLDERDSSALNTLAAANALIVRASGALAAKAGDEVDIYLLQNGGIA